MTQPQLDLGFEAHLDTGLKVIPPKPAKRPKHDLTSVADPAVMARELDKHPDYRVLKRLTPQLHFDRLPSGPVLTVVILDTETTGLDAAREKITELAMLRVDVDTVTGLPCGAVTVYDGLEDPGKPIPEEIVKLTGITDDMVKGRRLDEALIERLLQGVDLVLAHNAGFDRPFVEARLPQFAQLNWACSFADIDWKRQGQSSAKLEYLAMAQGWFYDAHRAEMDCHALLAVLCTRLPVTQTSGLARLMAVAQDTTFRLQATGAPFDAKDALRARGYRWNAAVKVWHTQVVSADLLDAECAWLKSEVYGQRTAQVQVELLDAKHRYSARDGERSTRTL